MNLDNSIGTNSVPICQDGNSKINTSNPKNKIWEVYKAHVKGVQEKKSEEMFKDLSFGDEYATVKMATDALKVFFSIASACTVFVAIYWALTPLLGSVIGGICSFGVCCLLEALKVFTWSKLSKNILKYKEYPVALVAAAIAFNLSSVGGSIFGAYQLPSGQAEFEPNSIALISIDSINQHYQQEITKIDGIIAQQSSEIAKTTSNSTKRSLAANIALQSNQKTVLLELKEKDTQAAKKTNENLVQEAKAANEKRNQKATEELQAKRTNCMVVSGVFELALLLCLVFGSYYLFRIEIDRNGGGVVDVNGQGADSTNGTVVHNVQSVQIPHAAPQLEQRRPITFKSYDEKRQLIKKQKVDEKRHQEEDGKRHPDLNKLDYTRICQLDSCKKPFIHGHGAQKYCSEKCRKKAHKQKVN